LFIAVRIVFPAEGDGLAIEVKQAVVTDGDSMSIAAEIAKNGFGSAE
jgi:hypothetical protein